MNDKLTVIGSKFYQQCEVVMLPNYEETNLAIDSLTGQLTYLEKKTKCLLGYFLYFLSSEEIKEGDLCLIDNNVGQSKGYQVLQCKKIDIDNGWYYFKDFKTGRCKKIIATTDFSLGHWNGEVIIGNFKSLPRPSDDFLKAFVKAQGKGFEKVLVEYEKLEEPTFDGNSEKYAEYALKVSPDNTITIKPIQEEKTSWSRKEVFKLCMDAMLYSYMDLPENLTPIQGMNKWIEENL